MMFNFIRRCLWEMFLIEDWYFITMEDHVVRPAFWNGVVWEIRTELLDDWRILRVHNRLPAGNPKYMTINPADHPVDVMKSIIFQWPGARGRWDEDFETEMRKICDERVKVNEQAP